MTADEFLTWCLGQDGKWELVNGIPIQMMAGATESHDRTVVNLIATLRERLRGGPCRTKTADQAARIPKGNFRRPDVTIDCGPPAPQSLESTAPSVFFEVLSSSTRTFDLLKKPEEYKTSPRSSISSCSTPTRRALRYGRAAATGGPTRKLRDLSPRPRSTPWA